MKIIEQIEIKNFRSFGNRKKESYKLIKIGDLNVISGANDSGKSNILRALNLFFNGQTNLNQFFDFERDFYTKENPDSDDIKEELVTVKVWFNNYKNKDKNIKQKSKAFLPSKFWVSKRWKKTSQYSSSDLKSSIDIEFKKEKGESHNNFLDENGELVSHFKAGLQKQLTDFLNSIQFHYVPAIKDRSYFSHLFGELQQTLWKTKTSKVESKKIDFENAIQEETDILMQEFKASISGNSKIDSFNPVFELPSDLINLFRALVVQTGNVDLTLRGDGLQAKLIPEILNFIAIKENSFTSRSIKSGYKAKKYFIWGFEEPENSYEYRNSQILANKFQNVFYKNAQIFITTHSFNFLGLEGSHISKYRVWKNLETMSSRISKLRKDKRGNIKFESNLDFKSDWKKLEEELGFFYLNSELKELYEKQEKDLNLLSEQIEKVNKPILYSEGNNIKFIKKAKEIFAPDIEIDIEDLGGKTDIKKFFLKLSRTNYSRFKMFFVFDCDANGEYMACNNEKTPFLHPYIFKQNNQNSIPEVKNGIENLFSEELFEDEKKLFSITEVKRDEIIISRDRKLRKPEFEKFILERRIDDDFRNFQELFNFIREEINGTEQDI